MSQKIQVKRGIKANLPVLSSGEPALTTDTEEVFFGNGTSNIELAKKSDLDKYVRNDQDSTINGNLSVKSANKILDLKSDGRTDQNDYTFSDYVFTPISSFTDQGDIAGNSGLELKQIGKTDQGDILMGLLKLSLDLNLNGNLSINNSNLVTNLNADLLDGKNASDFVLKNDKYITLSNLVSGATVSTDLVPANSTITKIVIDVTTAFNYTGSTYSLTCNGVSLMNGVDIISILSNSVNRLKTCTIETNILISSQSAITLTLPTITVGVGTIKIYYQ